MIPIVLTIGGSDSSGGAGIQADLKTIEALGCHAVTVITAVTAQSTSRVTQIHHLDASLIAQQLASFFEDGRPLAIKTGMLGNAETIDLIAKVVREEKIPLIVDPVLRATTGHDLMSQEAFGALAHLLPLATVITPNLHEASQLAGFPVCSVEDMKRAANSISKLDCAVLVKGGHLQGETIVDVLVENGRCHEFPKARISTTHTHGSGCCFASAIAAFLAHGKTLYEAVARAETFIERAIRFAVPYASGYGPVQPLAELRNDAARWQTLQRLQHTVNCLLELPLRTLIPEVGSNVVLATPYALTLEDFAGIDGRIVRTMHGVTAGRPGFGVSSHIGRCLLAMREHDPSIVAAINILSTTTTIAALEKLQLSGAFFSRNDEPMETKNREGSTISWAMRHVLTSTPGTPDWIADSGEVGKEPMIRLFARSAEQLIETVSHLDFCVRN